MNLGFKIFCFQGISVLLLAGCFSASVSNSPSSPPPPAGSTLSIFNLRNTVGDTIVFHAALEAGYLRSRVAPTVPDETAETTSPRLSSVTVRPGGQNDSISIFTKWDRTDALAGTFDVFENFSLTTWGAEFRKLTLLNMDFGGSGLNYTTYGLWERRTTDLGDTDERSVFARSFGFRTLDTAMPTSGIATYTGRMDGRYSASLARNQILDGSFQLTADFAAVTVTGAFTNVKLDGSDFRNINVSSSISATDFFGTVTTAPAAAGQIGPDMSGAIRGTFYGPSAEEVGGVFEMSGGGAVMTAGFAGAK
jgi:hypothetical protein